MLRSTAIHLALAISMLPTAAWAQSDPSDSGAFTLGRIVGIALFCYLIWRFFLRKK